MAELDEASRVGLPATADAPRLARRALRWRSEALAAGFDTVGLRAVRESVTSVRSDRYGVSSARRRSERRVVAEVARGGRASTLSTTALEEGQVISELVGLRVLMEQGASELFGAPRSARLGPAPVGPFDGLSLADPTVITPEQDRLRGYASAIARPADVGVSVTARTVAEAIARTDGGLVAVRHTHLDVELRTERDVLRRSARFLEDLPSPTVWADTIRELTMLRTAEPTQLPDAPVRLIVHPSAGAPLVRALVALPLRTQRLSSRLTIWCDPWVSRGVGSAPFNRQGEATRPMPLFEGGMQRRRWSGAAAQPGNLRVSRGGRPLERLVRESDGSVLVRHWRSVEVDEDSGRMELLGCGWTVAQGERVQPLPDIVVRGTLPALFGSLVQVGSRPFTGGLEHTPALVFEPVRVASS